MLCLQLVQRKSCPILGLANAFHTCRLGIPEGWVSGEGEIPTGPNGTRRTLAWFPKDGAARDLNVSVLVTNVSQEFTSLGEAWACVLAHSCLFREHLLQGWCTCVWVHRKKGYCVQQSVRLPPLRVLWQRCCIWPKPGELPGSVVPAAGNGAIRIQGAHPGKRHTKSLQALKTYLNSALHHKQL